MIRLLAPWCPLKRYYWAIRTPWLHNENERCYVGESRAGAKCNDAAASRPDRLLPCLFHLRREAESAMRKVKGDKQGWEIVRLVLTDGGAKETTHA